MKWIFSFIFQSCRISLHYKVTKLDGYIYKEERNLSYFRGGNFLTQPVNPARTQHKVNRFGLSLNGFEL